MKRILFVLALLCLEKTLHAQTPYIYTIKADSVKITNACDTAELIIENHTQNVPGFLFNKGRGRTEFKRVMQKINDTLVTIGGDSLRLPYAWLQGGNRFGTIGKFGTLDNNPIDFYTNDTLRGRWSTSGNLIVGNTIDNGSKFQVNGSSYFNGPQQITGTSSGTFHFAHLNFNPTVSSTSTEHWPYFYGARYQPVLNFSANNQQVYAVSVTPTYIYNGYQQHGDNISAAFDQTSSYDGNTGQPLFIYQAGSAKKELIRNYRNGNPSEFAFIWNEDNWPVVNKGIIVPALRSSILFPDAGGGISFTLDRHYWGTEASIDLKYETYPAGDTFSTVNTSVVFNTRSSGARVIPLYLNGSRVGMGTSIPSAQLHTTGTVRFAGLTNDNTQTRILVSDANGYLYYRNESTLALNETLNSDLAVMAAFPPKKCSSPKQVAGPIMYSVTNTNFHH